MQPPADDTAPARSFGALLRDVYLAPSEAFAELAERPRFWPALTGFVLVQAAFLAAWLSRMDLVAFTRAQAEAAGRAAPPPGAISESAQGAFKWLIGATGVAGAVLFVVAVAGVFLFIFNFLLGAQTTFRGALSVVSWSALATTLVIAPLMLLVMGLKGEWSLPPDQLLQANLAAFLERGSTGKFVFSLAQSVDLFWVWTLFLWSVGMARASRRPTATAATAVVTLYGLFALGKAAVAAVF